MKDDDVLYKFGDRIATWMFYVSVVLVIILFFSLM